MSNKKFYTFKEFQKIRKDAAEAMASDQNLYKTALDILVKADQYQWIHQTTWMGEPILNLPQDMFALQEIIYKTRPDYIIEAGVAWAGSLLFYSTLMEVLGGKGIIGIDIYIPDDLRKRINEKGKISEKIHLFHGSSTDTITVNWVRSIIGDGRNNLVILDSNHTHEHVLRELQIYSEFVGKGNYIVCGDTIIEDLPEDVHGPRPWRKGNNPKTALDEFLSVDKRFKHDAEIQNKLLFTCNPGGFLKCISD